MNVESLESLAAEWRNEVASLLKRGARREADCLESAAADLQARLTEWRYEELTLEVAAEESGYSYSRLQHLVGNEIENAGEPGSPKIRRCDLPKKPGHVSSPQDEDLVDRVLPFRRHG